MGKIIKTIQQAEEVGKKIKELKSSKGAEELKNLGETLLGKEKKETNPHSDVAKEYVDSEIKDLEKNIDRNEEKEKSRGFFGTVVTGTLGLLGYKTLSGESKETVKNVVTTGEKVIDLATDRGPEAEEKRKEVNDAIVKSKEVHEEIKEVQEKTRQKFKLEKKVETFFEKAEKYGAEDYKIKNVLSEAWKETEFIYDEEGQIEKKRGFLSRLFAFLPLFFQKFKNREVFQNLRKNGTLDKLKSAKKTKEEIEKEIDELKTDVKTAKKTQKEVKRPFNESPGILWSGKEIWGLSKTYKQELRSLAEMAGNNKLTKPEIKKALLEIVNKYKKLGFEKGGEAFLNNTKLREAFPGFKVSETALKSKSLLRGNAAFRLIEVSGKALGAFLRTGRKEGFSGGWESAKDVLTEADTWKDACPIWGTIRSFKKLNNGDGRSGWSKALEIGFSLGMDIAMIVGVVGSFGTATVGLVGARTAGMASLKGVAKRQLLREAEEMTSKESLTFFRKNAVKMAGGKWVVGFNLLATAAEEMFSDKDIDHLEQEAKSSLLTPEQQRSLRILKNQEAEYFQQQHINVIADKEEKERKKELKIKEDLMLSGHVSEAENLEPVSDEFEQTENDDENLIEKTMKLIPQKDSETKKDRSEEKSFSIGKKSDLEQMKKAA
jgi:hypothetical protein